MTIARTTKTTKTATTRWILAMGLAMAAITGSAAEVRAEAKRTVTNAAGRHQWPGAKGVRSTFVPSGRNYGNIGRFILKNNTDKPVTVVVHPGMLLDSSDPATQDLHIALVPTETPCEGAKYVGKPITIQPGATFVMADMPGFCPDFEKDPPKKGDAAVYACKQPDEKSKVLLATIALVKKINVASLDLDVFGEDKARQMMCQGALWVVDSRIDDVEANEVSSDSLIALYWQAFQTLAKAKLERNRVST